MSTSHEAPASGDAAHPSPEAAVLSTPSPTNEEPPHVARSSSSSTSSRTQLRSAEAELLRMLDEDARHAPSWFATPLRTLQQACMRVPQLSTILTGPQRYRLYVRLLLDADPLLQAEAAEEHAHSTRRESSLPRTLPADFADEAVHASASHTRVAAILAAVWHVGEASHPTQANATTANTHTDDASHTSASTAAWLQGSPTREQLEGFVYHFATATSAPVEHRTLLSALVLLATVLRDAEQPRLCTDGHVRLVVLYQLLAVVNTEMVATPLATRYERTAVVLLRLLLQYHDPTLSRHFDGSRIHIAQHVHAWYRALFCLWDYEEEEEGEDVHALPPLSPQPQKQSEEGKARLTQEEVSRRARLVPTAAAGGEEDVRTTGAETEETALPSVLVGGAEEAKAKATAAAANTNTPELAKDEAGETVKEAHTSAAATASGSATHVWHTRSRARLPAEREARVRDALMIMDWVFIVGDPAMLPYVALSYLITHRRRFLAITAHAELRRAVGPEMRLVLPGRREEAVSPRLVDTYQQVSLGSVWSGKSLLQNAELIYRKTPLSAQRVLEFCQYPDRGTINYSAEAAEAYYEALPCLPLERIDVVASFGTRLAAGQATHAADVGDGNGSRARQHSSSSSSDTPPHPPAGGWGARAHCDDRTHSETGAAPDAAEVQSLPHSSEDVVHTNPSTTTATTTTTTTTVPAAAETETAVTSKETANENDPLGQHTHEASSTSRKAHNTSDTAEPERVSSHAAAHTSPPRDHAGHSDRLGGSLPALDYIVLDCRSRTSFDYARLPTAIHVGDVIGYDATQLDEVLARVMSIRGAHLTVFGTGRSLTEELNLLKMLVLHLVGRHFPHVSLCTGGFRSLIPLVRRREVRVEQGAGGGGGSPFSFRRAAATASSSSSQGLFTLPASVQETAAQTTHKITSALNNLTEYLPHAAAESGDAVRHTAEQLRSRAKEGVEVASAWGWNVMHKMQEKLMEVREQVKQTHEAAVSHTTTRVAPSEEVDASSHRQGRVVGMEAVRGPVVQGIAQPSSSAAAAGALGGSLSTTSTSQQVAQKQQSTPSQQPQHFFSLGEDTDDDDFGLITSIPPRPLKGASVGTLIRDGDKTAAASTGGGSVHSAHTQPAALGSGSSRTTMTTQQQQHADPQAEANSFLRASEGAASVGAAERRGGGRRGGTATTEDFTAAIDAEFEELFGEEFTATTGKTAQK